MADAAEAATGPLAQYFKEVTLYDEKSRTWRDLSDRIVKRYKDERNTTANLDSPAHCNYFWSYMQTLGPALYSKNPKPDIQRRFKDADPVGRVSSNVLERCVSYFTDSDDFSLVQRQITFDYGALGRGTSWIRYDPTLTKEDIQVTNDALPGDGGDAKTQAVEKIEYEDVAVDYVHLKDYGHNICRTWQEVWLVWRIVYMTREQIKVRFPDVKPEDVPLDYREKTSRGETIDDGIGKASIYEAWDKSRKKAVWFHKDVKKPLDERDDPLKLKDFFPTPRPLLSNMANDSLVPTPDYKEFEDQLIELDNLTARIASITKSVKVAGVYDSSAQGIGRLLSEGLENTLIPVEQWAVFAEKGGLDGAMSFLPLADIVNALKSLYEAVDRVKQNFWEISGQADIMRGVSDPDETAAAQKIKSSFGTMRLSDRQREVQRFIRDTIKIMVEVMCNHFQDETIKQISGVRLFDTAAQKTVYTQPQAPQMMAQGGPPPPPMPPPPPPGVSADQLDTMLSDPSWEEVFGLIRNNPVRCFRIDIETDSTIKMDEQADKASRIEFIEAIGKYIGSAMQTAQEQPEMMPFLAQGLMFLARGFPVGKEFEGTLNAMIAKLEKAAANPQPKPNPEMMKVQADAQLQQQKAQSDAQLQAQKTQADLQIAQQKAQIEAQMQQQSIQADAQAEAVKAQAQAAVQQHLNELENARRQQEIASEERMQQIKINSEGQIELAKAEIQQQTAIAVARIAAGASGGENEEATANARVDQDLGPVKDEVLHAKIDQLSSRMDGTQSDMATAMSNIAQAHQQTAQGIQAMHKSLSSEKEIVRDPKTGKATGVRTKPDPKDLANQLRK